MIEGTLTLTDVGAIMVDIQSELHFLTIREAADLLRSQQLSPVELTRAFLDRIDATDGQLHSFITLLREEALADARLAEAEILRGEYKGPLHGIPFALKDLYDTAGIRTTAGSRVNFDRVPEQEHWGGWVATFRDPDGNMLQLLEQPPDRKPVG